MTGSLRRVFLERRLIIVPLAVALLVNAAIYALVVYPSSDRVARETEREQVALRELATAQRDFAAAARVQRDKARANLDVVLGRLDAAREEARIEELMKRYGQAAAGDVADRMLSAQRDVLASLDDPRLRLVAVPYDRFDFYFAGPPPMVEAVQNLLMARQRVPFGQIHFDRFV